MTPLQALAVAVAFLLSLTAARDVLRAAWAARSRRRRALGTAVGVALGGYGLALAAVTAVEPTSAATFAVGVVVLAAGGVLLRRLVLRDPVAVLFG
jgi:hypothetical protein